MFNCSLWPSDLPLTNPFPIRKFTLWPSGDPDKSSPSGWPEGLITSHLSFCPFGSTLLQLEADKSTVANDVTHTHAHISSPSPVT